MNMTLMPRHLPGDNGGTDAKKTNLIHNGTKIFQGRLLDAQFVSQRIYGLPSILHVEIFDL